MTTQSAKERVDYDALRAAYEAQKEEIERLTEFRTGEIRKFMQREFDALGKAQRRSAALEAALQSLLLKCPNCGGCGEVETGRIQLGYPSLVPCGLCSGERKMFDEALKGTK